MSRKNVLESQQGGNDTYGTPDAAIRLAEAVLGPICWDPCGNPKQPLYAHYNTLLPQYENLPVEAAPSKGAVSLDYGNSLSNAYRARWATHYPQLVNPPWSDIDPWIDRLRQSPAFAFVGPARVNAGWFHALAEIADVIWLPNRRFTYRGAKIQPPFHSFMAFRCQTSGVPLAREVVAKAIPQFFPKERKGHVLLF